MKILDPGDRSPAIDRGSQRQAIECGDGSMAQAAKTGRARVRGAASPVLPDELVVWEILVRVPAKELLRCRAVCRSWRRLTSTADFLLAHHRHQPSLPLVSFCGRASADNGGLVDAALDAFDLRQRPTKRQPVLRFTDYKRRSRYTVHGSCDGLILLSVSNGRFYLCNPATRHWIALPRLNGARVAGMYPHSSTGEYRVLYCKGAKSADDAVYYVLTVGSAAEPRCIGQPVASPAVKQFIRGGLDVRIVSKCPPVFLRNSLHWVRYCPQGSVIVVFDTLGESFRLMHYPTDAREAFPYLLEMDGTMGISWANGSYTMVNLFVLQDYETQTWSLKYQIQCPVTEMSSIVEIPLFSGLIVSENGDALVRCSDPSGSYHMFHCDSKGKVLQKFHWDQVITIVTGLQFKENVFRHAFFERENGRRRARQPCFFRGL